MDRKRSRRGWLNEARMVRRGGARSQADWKVVEIEGGELSLQSRCRYPSSFRSKTPHLLTLQFCILVETRIPCLRADPPRAYDPQEELGAATSYGDIGTIGGELFATALTPVAASALGWRGAFLALGASTLCFTPIWVMLARSRPAVAAGRAGKAGIAGKVERAGKAGEAGKAGGGRDGSKSTLDGGDGRAGGSADDKGEDSGGGGGGGKVGSADGVSCGHHGSNDDQAGLSGNHDGPGGLPPIGAALLLPVWAVIGQHMAFNGSKYFYGYWIARYFATELSVEPEVSARYLGFVQLLGVFCPLAWRRCERCLLYTSDAADDTPC
eukprot:2377035-Pleurochrysis_carterae.AAC.1